MGGTYSDLLCHVVFSTKNRLPLISDLLEPSLHEYMGGVVRGQGATLVEVGGMSDHVHLLLRLRPTHCMATLMRELKSGTSKWVNSEKWKLRKFGWQDGYGVFSVSRSQVTRVQRYIQQQRRHHRRTDFKTEFLELLKRHEVHYDERHLWK